MLREGGRASVVNISSGRVKGTIKKWATAVEIALILSAHAFDLASVVCSALLSRIPRLLWILSIDLLEVSSIWNSGAVEYDITSFTWAICNFFEFSHRFLVHIPSRLRYYVCLHSVSQNSWFPTRSMHDSRSLYAATHLTSNFLDSVALYHTSTYILTYG